jgi:hypothetical protein
LKISQNKAKQNNSWGVAFKPFCSGRRLFLFSRQKFVFLENHFSMKVRFLIATICLTALACSARERQDGITSLADSLNSSMQSTETKPDAAPAELLAVKYDGNDSIATAIQEAVDRMKSQYSRNYSYSLNGTYSGYESSADATYYFDSFLHLTFCEVSWNSEGSSGEQSYYFKDDDFVGGMESNYYTNAEETIWIDRSFKPVFGFSKSN